MKEQDRKKKRTADVTPIRGANVCIDAHETVRLGEGTWMVRRQREYVPEGYKMVID